ncbi:hypothetical protein HA466_0092120 [Hirschfeldia incana]|nr:hypothetical protein HA466_0092120 [Hirschfeldia incana]
MVFPGERDSMATGHEKPKKVALHNFRFSSWGIQQNMRCVKVEPHGGSGDSEEGIEEFREKIMLDIRTVKASIFREHDVLGYEEEEDEEHMRTRKMNHQKSLRRRRGRRWR